MQLNIKTLNFEGPFDLLLHLIKKNEMDIYDIKIYEITRQYLDYLDKLKEMDLEITSEFIVIAATLIEIKSKMLLPKDKKEEERENNNDDPRKELVEKLIEYKKFKLISQYLRDREVGLMFSKKPETIQEREYDFNDIFKNISMIQLFNIYDECMNIFRSKLNTENVIDKLIPLDVFKIEDKMIFLKEAFIFSKNLCFTNIIKDCSGKNEIIVTFLAMLELIKLREIKVVQYGNFNEIYLERVNYE